MERENSFALYDITVATDEQIPMTILGAEKHNHERLIHWLVA